MTLTNPTNRMAIYSESFCQKTGAQPGSTDIANILFCKLRLRQLLSAAYQFWISLHVMLVASRHAALAQRVLNIVRACTKEQMRRVDAVFNVAFVADHESFRYWTERNCPCKPMSALAGASPMRDESVATRLTNRSSPQPAFGTSPGLDMTPESFSSSHLSTLSIARFGAVLPALFVAGAKIANDKFGVTYSAVPLNHWLNISPTVLYGNS